MDRSEPHDFVGGYPLSRLSRLATCLAALLVGCGLVLEFAGGQDGPGGGKAKKEKGPKGDKWDGFDPEEKAVYKTAEKALKAPETECDKWLKELNKAYPGQVTPGLSEADFGQWFGLLVEPGGEWRRDDAPIKQVAELFDRAAGRLNLGGVATLRRNEFMAYARQFLIPGSSPLWKPLAPIAEADKMFRQLDRDGSGFLEPNEWPDRLRAVANRVDADRDGRISPDEYRAYFEGRVLTTIEFGPNCPAPTAHIAASGRAGDRDLRGTDPLRAIAAWPARVVRGVGHRPGRPNRALRVASGRAADGRVRRDGPERRRTAAARRVPAVRPRSANPPEPGRAVSAARTARGTSIPGL